MDENNESEALPSDGRTLYEVLNVLPGAHPTEIRLAYRYLVGIYHPDNEKTGDPQKFREISVAYKMLSDAGRRAAYDKTLRGPLDFTP
jgi:DnaJ homolog subfamily A member 2